MTKIVTDNIRKTAVEHFLQRVRDYFADTTVQGRIEKRGRFREAEWWLENVIGMSRQEITDLYTAEYWKQDKIQM